jgi:hypothetical protein
VNIHFKNSIYDNVSKLLSDCNGEDETTTQKLLNWVLAILVLDRDNIYFSTTEKNRLSNFMQSINKEITPIDQLLNILDKFPFPQDVNEAINIIYKQPNKIPINAIAYEFIGPEYIFEIVPLIKTNSDINNAIFNQPKKFDHFPVEKVWQILNNAFKAPITCDEFFNLQCTDQNILQNALIAFLVACDHKKHLDKLMPYIEHTIDYKDFVNTLIKNNQFELLVPILKISEGKLVARKILLDFIKHIKSNLDYSYVIDNHRHALDALKILASNKTVKFLNKETKYLIDNLVETINLKISTYSIQNQKYFKEIQQLLKFD